MPQRERARVEPTDEWHQLAALATWPEQRAYEQLRPVVLFGHPVAERARETLTPERTRYRRAARFDAEGMASLFPPPKVEKHRRLPDRICGAIRALKAEHPAFRAHELADICDVRFGRRPSPHTVKRILAAEPPLPRTARRFPPYRDIADPTEACLAIIRLHSEGRPVKRIAAYLECSRHLPGEPNPAHLRGARDPQGGDRPAATLAESERGQLRRPDADGRLWFRERGDLGGAPARP